MIQIEIALELLKRAEALLLSALFPATETRDLEPDKWMKANRAHSKLVDAIRQIRSFINDR